MAYLNHGGFGAVPGCVLDEQQRLRALMERNPTDFFARGILPMLAEVRETLARLIGADPAGLVFVPNATAGVHTALRSLRLGPGDEILTTDHCYNAVRVQLGDVANRTGATVAVAALPMPVTSAEAIVAAVVGSMTERTKALVVDQVTSPTGVVLPVRGIVRAARERGIVTLVDGAHALGMLALDVAGIGADYWTGNAHKWLCAPKSAAVLWVAPEHRSALRPLVPSHFYDEGLHRAFDWTGTTDPTPVLASVAAVEFFSALGWDAVRQHNRDLAAEGARLVADALGTDVPVADECAGAMRVVSLPSPLQAEDARVVEQRLLDEHAVEVPLTAVGTTRWVRLSAQVYNTLDDYARLATALPKVLESV